MLSSSKIQELLFVFTLLQYFFLFSCQEDKGFSPVKKFKVIVFVPSRKTFVFTALRLSWSNFSFSYNCILFACYQRWNCANNSVSRWCRRDMYSLSQLRQCSLCKSFESSRQTKSYDNAPYDNAHYDNAPALQNGVVDEHKNS